MEIENRRAFAADLRASILTLEHEVDPLRQVCAREKRKRMWPWIAAVLVALAAIFVNAWISIALLPLLLVARWLRRRPPTRSVIEWRRVNGVLIRMKALEADFNQGHIDIETAQARHREWV